ncbi:uncharacterized protein LOC136026014 isoform X2 [Artemia franciscana]|nr:hypothetical protein QYM36_012283 [Artemia franciscana]
MFELNFQYLDLGRVEANGSCSGGYLKIIEETTDELRVLKSTREIGRFCGKTKSNTLLRFADSIYLFYYSDYPKKENQVRIRTSVLPKLIAEDRFPGLTHSMNPTIPEYVDCDKLIQSCSKTGCTITSPGFPGSYIRAIVCRYYISFNQGSQIMIGGNILDEYDVGTMEENCKKCDRNVQQTQCRNDRISVFEGRHDFTEEIVRFCGKGSIPKVVSRGNEIVIEFYASQDGRMHKGFHITVHQLLSKIDETRLGKTIKSENHLQGYIRPIRHWYPPGYSTEAWLIGKPSEKVWIQVHYKVKDEKILPDPYRKKEETCKEKWSIYEAAEIGKELIGSHCSDNRENIIRSYSSKSNQLLIEFESVQGSTDGTSSDFTLFFLFYNDSSGGVPQEPPCSEVFHLNSTQPRLSLILLQNRLLLRAKSLSCSYKIKANDNERLRLTTKRIKFDPIRQCSSSENNKNNLCSLNVNKQYDTIKLLDSDGDIIKCICLSSTISTTYWTTGSEIKLLADLTNIYPNSFKDRSLYQFEFEIEALENNCGVPQESTHTGKIVFPEKQLHSSQHEIDCFWKVELPKTYQPVFKISQLTLDKYCKESFLSFTFSGESEPYSRLCNQNQNSNEVLPSHWGEPQFESRSSKVIIRLRSIRPTARFVLKWTSVAARWLLSSNDSKTIKENDECEFRCKDGISCIPKYLVCDGAIDCPQGSYLGEPLDEAPETCLLITSRDYININWTIPVLIFTVILATILLTILCCKKSRDVNNVGVSTFNEKHYL